MEATIHRFSAIDAAMTAYGFEIYDVIDICHHQGKFWQCNLVFYNRQLAQSLGAVRSDDVSDLADYEGFVPEAWIAAPSAQPTLSSPEATELANFRLMSSSAVRKLARSGALESMDWKHAAKEKPFDVHKWNALRRAKRRLSSQTSDGPAPHNAAGLATPSVAQELSALFDDPNFRSKVWAATNVRNPGLPWWQYLPKSLPDKM